MVTCLVTATAYQMDVAHPARRPLAFGRPPTATSLEVSVADKLHNATGILEDYEAIGADLWERFNEKRPEAQLWCYMSLAGVFEERIPDHPLTAELAVVPTELERRVLADRPDLAHDGPWSARP